MPRWTPEAKMRQAELIRGWRPWEQSTGARTPEGKAASSLNAYKHGWYTADFLALRKIGALKVKLIKQSLVKYRKARKRKARAARARMLVL